MMLKEALEKTTFLVQQECDLNHAIGRDGQPYIFDSRLGAWKIWKDCPDSTPGFVQICIARAIADDWRSIEGVRVYQ